MTSETLIALYFVHPNPFILFAFILDHLLTFFFRFPTALSPKRANSFLILGFAYSSSIYIVSADQSATMGATHCHVQLIDHWQTQ
jgi:hypothetical protein